MALQYQFVFGFGFQAQIQDKGKTPLKFVVHIYGQHVNLICNH
jgi:hypothetical protein